MVQVKICGLKTPEMVRVCAASGADWIGLNLVPASPRNILGDGAGGSDLLYDLLFAAADVEVRTVALVADADERTRRILSGAVMPDVIQLHGKETPDQVAEWKAAVPPSIEIWKAVGVSEAADLASANAYRAADRLCWTPSPQRAQTPLVGTENPSTGAF